uniref:Uncharacterized protein n=1 Tax=Rhizophagus irregularis (strain DAOM 181602 / DAOM 197198 / MUCL 43194) TaxID=747089 RepID=U9U4J6_RHIID
MAFYKILNMEVILKLAYRVEFIILGYLKQINYSPKKEIVGDFAKTQWCRKFYIPTWSEKEIEISIQENITTSLLETLENKFELCEKLRNYKEHLRNFVEGAGNILGMELSMDSYSNWYHIQFFVKEELVFIMLTRQEQVYYRWILSGKKSESLPNVFSCPDVMRSIYLEIRSFHCFLETYRLGGGAEGSLARIFFFASSITLLSKWIGLRVESPLSPFTKNCIKRKNPSQFSG